MRRVSMALIGMVLFMTTLVGCGGGDPYCDTVKKDQKTLNSFGQTRTNAAYKKYSTEFRKVSKVAPKSVKADWAKLADVTDDVLEAQKDVGLKLEDMPDDKKVAKVDSAGLQKLNKAYKAFNATTKERAAVVKNVKQKCKITLK